MNQPLTALIAALIATALLSGCGGGSHSASPAGTGTTTLQQNVTAIPADGSVTLSNVTSSSVTLTGNALPALSAGSVIVGGPAPGVMRKVVSVAQSGNTETVQTTDAALTDVFKEADITYSGPLGFTSATSTQTGVTISGSAASSVSPSAQLRSTHTLTAKASSSSGTENLAFSNVQITPGSGSASLTLNGSASINASINCHIHISLLSSDYSASFVPTITGTANVTATANGTATLPSVQIQIAQLQCSPILIEVGLVPLWITPSITLYTNADGQIEAGVTFQSSGSMSAAAGVQYQSGSGWSTVQTYSQSLNLVPTVTASASAVFHLTPVNVQLSATINGIVSAVASIDCPKFTFSIVAQTAAPPPSVTIEVDADLDGSAGFQSTILGFDAGDLLTFDKHYVLYKKVLATVSVTGTFTFHSIGGGDLQFDTSDLTINAPDGPYVCSNYYDAGYVSGTQCNINVWGGAQPPPYADFQYGINLLFNLPGPAPGTYPVLLGASTGDGCWYPGVPELTLSNGEFSPSPDGQFVTGAVVITEAANGEFTGTLQNVTAGSPPQTPSIRRS